MKSLLSLFFFISLLIIISFLLFSGMEPRVEMWLQSTRNLWSYSVFSFLLIIGDIVLPVPSSLVMILNGKLLGIFKGTCLSLVSGTTSSVIGFYLGSKSSGFLRRYFNAGDIEAGNRFFNRYGVYSVSVSKALPVLSETISFISGYSGLSVKKFLFYSLTGHFLVSVAYAFIGHFAVLYNSYVLAGIVITLALIISWVLRLLVKSRS